MGVMASLFFLVVGTANIAPWWAMVPLALAWLITFARTARAWEHHPVRAFWISVVMLVIWVTTVVLGTRLGGWGG